MAARFVCILAAAVCFVSGCGPGVNVTDYFGLGSEDIKLTLGQPNGPRPLVDGEDAPQTAIDWYNGLVADMNAGRSLFYWDGSSDYLPGPITDLDIIFSAPDGYCFEVSGETEGFETPENLLHAIGLGAWPAQSISRDKMSAVYSVGPFERVEVRLKHSGAGMYTKFVVTDVEAAEGYGADER